MRCSARTPSNTVGCSQKPRSPPSYFARAPPVSSSAPSAAAALDVAEDTLELGGRNQRSHARLGIERVARPELPGALDDPFQQLLLDRGCHQQS